MSWQYLSGAAKRKIKLGKNEQKKTVNCLWIDSLIKYKVSVRLL